MKIKIKLHWVTILMPLVFLPVLMQDGYLWYEALYKGAQLVLLIQFSAILPHELGHLLASMRIGIRRGELIFGGLFGAWCPEDDDVYARLTPGQRLVIVVLGPVSNLLVAGVIWGMHLLFPELLPADWEVVIMQIILFNLFMAIVNLLPIFPLDGGQILKEIFLLLRLSPERIFQGMRISALLFGGGWLGILICNGHWMDWMLWLIFLCFAATFLADRQCFMFEIFGVCPMSEEDSSETSREYAPDSLSS